MKPMQTMVLSTLLAASCGYSYAQNQAVPAASAIIRKALLTAAISPNKSIANVEIKEITLGRGQNAPLHLHPCPVVGVITAGSIAFQIEGQAVQHLKAGDAFYEPANVRIARFDNDGETPATFSAFYLLGEGEHEIIRLLPN